MKTYVNLIFITFLFYVNADEMHWTSNSRSEFKATLRNLNISNTVDYIQFLADEGKDLGFPTLKELPLIYPDEGKGLDDLFKGTPNNTQFSKNILKKHEVSFIKYTAFIFLMEAQGIRDDNSYQAWYEDNRDIFNVPRFPEEVYPEFKNWKILQESQPKTKSQLKTKSQQKNKSQPKTKSQQKNKSQPKTKSQQKNKTKLKNHPPYHKLKKQVQARNFKSAREYKRRYKEIPNAPSNPENIYEEWEDWNTFLGKIVLLITN